MIANSEKRRHQVPLNSAGAYHLADAKEINLEQRWQQPRATLQQLPLAAKQLRR